MLPFANRLPASGFVFGDRRAQPQAGPLGLVQHGLAHRAAWRVQASGTDTLSLVWTHVPDTQWPWAFCASQIFRLSPDGLTLNLGVRNQGDIAMPLVLGWHPYHPLADGVIPQGTPIRAQTQHSLDHEGHAGPPTTRSDRDALALAPGETLAFAGWDGHFRLGQGADGAIVTRSRGTSNLVLHAAPDARYLCVEPVTQLPGHLICSAQPAVLAPGERADLQWSCAWEAS
jgi:aldose 1-epimerase